MTHPYASHFILTSGLDVRKEFATLKEAHADIEEVIRTGSVEGFVTPPKRVSLLVRDAGQFKVTWSYEL